MPAVSVRDIAVQPDSNDLLLATHGRAVYVLDDLTPLQQWQTASGTRLFPVRAAYQWNTHQWSGTHTDGAAPPYGAIITFYLDRLDKDAHAEILDARGHAIRHFSAKDLSPQAGFNRFVWDTTQDKPVDWKFAPPWNSGLANGVPVVPGTYTALVHAGGLTMRTPVVVRQDPRTHFTAAQPRTAYNEQVPLYDDFDRVDAALNVLSTVINEAPLRSQGLSPRGQGSLYWAVTELRFKRNVFCSRSRKIR